MDALVVGAGPSGTAAALELEARGRRVEMVDDDLGPGGSLAGLVGEARGPWEPLLETLRAAASGARIAVRRRTTAAGVYGNDVLLASEEGVEVVTARTLVLAPGAHDSTPVFAGNDLPGVVSARAAGRLLGHGVLLGNKVVVLVLPGGGPFGAAYVAARPGVTLVEGVPVRARGSARVRGVTIATGAGDRDLRCDALVIDGPRAPAYEVCAQAGAELVHESRGFVVRTAEGGKVREGVFACGEAVGTPLDPVLVRQEARALAEGAN